MHAMGLTGLTADWILPDNSPEGTCLLAHPDIGCNTVETIFQSFSEIQWLRQAAECPVKNAANMAFKLGPCDALRKLLHSKGQHYNQSVATC